MSLHYAWEKTFLAVLTLAEGTDRIQRRLGVCWRDTVRPRAPRRPYRDPRQDHLPQAALREAGPIRMARERFRTPRS